MSIIEQVIQAVLEASKYVPSWLKILFPRLTYFSAKDEWRYIAIMDDRTCKDCSPRDGLLYTGEFLRLEFPWLEVESSDAIHPHVHPNCRCVMLRESWLREDLNGGLREKHPQG